MSLTTRFASRLAVFAFAGSSLLFAACGDDGDQNSAATVPEPTHDQVMAAEDALPADPRLADIYERSCMACHTIPESGAPLTLYTAAWQPRMDAKGMDALVTSAKVGLNAMPPMGQCPDCTDDDFADLITFMMVGD